MLKTGEPTGNTVIMEIINDEIDTSGEARIQINFDEKENIDVLEVTKRFPLTKKGVFKEYEKIHEELNHEFENGSPFTVSFPGQRPDKVIIYYSLMAVEKLRGYENAADFDCGKWYVRKAYKKTVWLSSGNELLVYGLLSTLNDILYPGKTEGYRIIAKYPGGQKKEIAFTIKSQAINYDDL